MRAETLDALSYFLAPSELFTAIAKKGAFIIGEPKTILGNIERSTMGAESEGDFDHLFEDLDLDSSKLGRTVAARNEIIARVLTHLDAIDFGVEDVEADILGDAYEYLISQFASGAGKKAGEQPDAREGLRPR